MKIEVKNTMQSEGYRHFNHSELDVKRIDGILSAPTCSHLELQQIIAFF